MTFRGKPRVVDLTTRRKLATGVTEACASCTEDDRDAALYYILARCVNGRGGLCRWTAAGTGPGMVAGLGLGLQGKGCFRRLGGH